MAQVDAEKRDRRGDWQPAELLAPPPLFTWPPRPAGVFKWLFGWEGYLWPWNAAYLAIAILTWLFLTPDLATMQTFEVWWITLIFARNLALTFLIVGAWHLRLYIQKAQGQRFKYSSRWLATSNPIFLFGNQTLDNMFWTLASAVPIWTAYEVVTWWAFANGFIPYVDWLTHPIYCTVLILLVPLIRELHFYLIHRLIHWPPLYRTVHHLHHKNVNVGPWSGLAMHPVEHLLYFSGVLLHWIIPSHPIHALFHLQHAAFAPAQGHSGFERVVVKGDAAVETGNFFHYLHHKYFECNYGGDGAIPIDKWFGTFHDGSKAAEDAMNRRFMSRRR